MRHEVSVRKMGASMAVSSGLTEMTRKASDTVISLRHKVDISSGRDACQFPTARVGLRVKLVL